MLSFPTIYYGAVINPRTLTSYDALPNCLLAVSPAGNIDWIVEDVIDSMVQEIMSQKGCVEAEVVTLKHGEFIIPGFIDTHTHAPQVPNTGIGGQYQLLDWLENCTFPMEAKFSDVEFARKTYQSVVRRIINCGTTTCCYYGTIHLEGTKVLADIVHEYGQRAFVGKCNMNRHSPDYYIEPSSEHSIATTEALIKYIRSLPLPNISGAATQLTSDRLVQPVLTPRFAISCTSDLLNSLGKIAASDPSLCIQTHISENLNEVALTKNLFPNSETYAGVYDDHGLLRETTILAHAVHLEEAEMKLIEKRKAGVSHCPTSNFHLSSGVAKVGEFLDRGIKVGLGTDVSGGFSPSILTVIQHASIASKVRSFSPNLNSDPPRIAHAAAFTDQPLSVATLLHLATLGGAQVCCLEDKIGSFATGKSFDALIVSVRDEADNPSLWGGLAEREARATSGKERLEGMLERFLFCGDDRNISRVYVQGRCIGGGEFRK